MSVTTYEYNTDIVLPLRIAQNLKFCKLCHWIYPLYQQIKCSLLLWLCYQVFYVLVIQTKKTKSFKKPNILESLVSDALKHILLNNFWVIRPLTQRLPHSIIPAFDISGSQGHLIIVLEFQISRPGSQSYILFSKFWNRWTSICFCPQHRAWRLNDNYTFFQNFVD